MGMTEESNEYNVMMLLHSATNNCEQEPKDVKVSSSLSLNPTTDHEFKATAPSSSDQNRRESDAGGGFTKIGNKENRINDDIKQNTPKKRTAHCRQQQHKKTPYNTPPEYSFIKDEDMIRIRNAESIILQEEQIYGRYLRASNSSGEQKLVPAWKEERIRFENNLRIDDQRPLNQEARVSSQFMAPFAIQAGIGHDPFYSTDSESESEIEDKDGKREEGRTKLTMVKMSSDHNNTPTTAKSKNRMGGELFSFPSSDNHTYSEYDHTSSEHQQQKQQRQKAASQNINGSSKKRTLIPPPKRNRLYFTNIDLTQKQTLVQKLEYEINQMENELMSMNLTVIEGGSTNDEEKQESLRNRIQSKKETLKMKLKEKERTEKQLIELKRILKYSENRYKARVLERKRRIFYGRSRNYIESSNNQNSHKLDGDDDRQDHPEFAFSENEEWYDLMEQEQVLPKDEREAIMLEDIAIIHIQKIIRGKLTRSFYHKHRIICELSSSRISAGIRGMLDRKKVFKIRSFHSTANSIQKLFRGYAERKNYVKFFTLKKQQKSSVIIQRNIRGMLDRIFVTKKKTVEKFCLNATHVVSVRELCADDLIHLADGIQQYSIHCELGNSNNISTVQAASEEEASSYRPPKAPPQSILGLIKIVFFLLGDMMDQKQQCKNSATDQNEIYNMTTYSLVGVKSYSCVTPNNIRWEHVIKYLHRSQRLIHKMRRFCDHITMIVTRDYPISITPPPFQQQTEATVPSHLQDGMWCPFCHLSFKAIHLYQAYQKDPDFSLETFSKIGKGSKAACQIMKWVDSLMSIHFDHCQKQLNKKVSTVVYKPMPLSYVEDDEQNKQEETTTVSHHEKKQSSGWFHQLQSLYISKRKILCELEIQHKYIQEIENYYFPTTTHDNDDSLMEQLSPSNNNAITKSQENFLAEEQEKESMIIESLKELSNEISMKCKRDRNEEDKKVKLVYQKVEKLKEDIETAKQAYFLAQMDFQNDIFTDSRELEELALNLEERELALQFTKSLWKAYIHTKEYNERKRSECQKVGLCKETSEHCIKLGSILGKLAQLRDRKKNRLKEIGNVDMVVDLKYNHDKELLQIGQDIESLKFEKGNVEIELQESLNRFEDSLLSYFDSIKVEQRNHENEEISSEEEKSDHCTTMHCSSALEDETMAQEERLRRKSYVPYKVIASIISNNEAGEETGKKNTPKFICLSRDIPSLLRKNIARKLFLDLNGSLATVSIKENLGIDQRSFQKVFDSGQSVLADVDVGMGNNTRRMFLQSFEIVKEGLYPSPNESCVCIMGSTANKKGVVAATSSIEGEGEHDVVTLGCDKHNLLVMQNGELKEQLEILNHITSSLRSCKIIEEQMLKHGALTQPVSNSYSIVMEAVMILLSPESEATFSKTLMKKQRKNTTFISWEFARKLLNDPQNLQQQLGKVVYFGGISDDKLGILQSYLKFCDWPKQKSLDQSEILLRLLSKWVVKIVRVGFMLRDAGGLPNQLYESKLREVFKGIAIIPDDEGWKVRYDEVLLILLEQNIVHRDKREINGYDFDIKISFYIHTLFFFARRQFDKKLFVTKVDLKDIDQLLTPNSMERTISAKRYDPPQTKSEVFSKLCDLLILTSEVKTHSRRGGEILLCKRRLTRLCKETTKISGHLVTVTASEDSRGELLYEVYVPHFSTTLHFKVEQEDLLNILPNADKYFEEKEFDSSDARTLLRPLTDRLKIFPRFRTVIDMGFNLKSTPLQIINPQRKLSLGIRMKGGVGRELFTCLNRSDGELFVIKVYEVGEDSVLRVKAYNSHASVEDQIKLTKEDRLMFLDSKNSDWKKWKHLLLKRLNIKNVMATSRKRKLDVDPIPLCDYCSSIKMLEFDRIIFQSETTRIGEILFSVKFELSIPEWSDTDNDSRLQQNKQKLLAVFVNLGNNSNNDKNKYYEISIPLTLVYKIASGDPNNPVAIDDIYFTLKEPFYQMMLKYFDFNEQENSISFTSEYGLIKAEAVDMPSPPTNCTCELLTDQQVLVDEEVMNADENCFHNPCEPSFDIPCSESQNEMEEQKSDKEEENKEEITHSSESRVKVVGKDVRHQLLLRAGFNIPLSNTEESQRTRYQSIVSVFQPQSVNPNTKKLDKITVIWVHLYVPALSESCRIQIGEEEQRIAIGGRSISSFKPNSESMDIALRRIIKCLVLSFDTKKTGNNSVERRKGNKKTRMLSVRFRGISSETQPWQNAYMRLA